MDEDSWNLTRENGCLVSPEKVLVANGARRHAENENSRHRRREMTERLVVGTAYVEPGCRGTGWLTVGELDQLGFGRGQLRLPVLLANGAKAGPMLAMIAGQHPGEYVGMNAAISIMQAVDLAQLAGSIVCLPILNPYGVRQKIPYVCPFDGLNMNRQWPGTYGGSISMRTTHAVWQSVISRADYLIDLHGGDFPEYQADYAICFETGNASIDEVSRQMARHFGANYIRTSPLSEGGQETGAAARMAMQVLGIPSIVTEVGDAGSLDSDRLRANVDGLFNILKYLKLLPSEPSVPPRAQREMINRLAVLARTDGLSRLTVGIGETVNRGTVLAQIHDECGQLAEELVSPIDGDVVQLFYQGWINKGEIVAKVAALREAAKRREK
jgi:predicted deacylase